MTFRGRLAGKFRINLPGTFLGRRSQDVPTGLLEDVLETLWGRLLVVSKFHFTFLSELVRLTNLTKSNAIIRGVFRTQSNFEDGFFLRKQLMLLALNYFREKAPSLKVDWIINTLLILSSNIIWLWVDSVQHIFRIGVSLICALYIENEEWIGYKLYYRKIIYITSNNKNFKVYLQ